MLDKICNINYNGVSLITMFSIGKMSYCIDTDVITVYLPYPHESLYIPFDDFIEMNDIYTNIFNATPSTTFLNLANKPVTFINIR